MKNVSSDGIALIIGHISIYGIALIIGSAGAVVTMTFHPSGQDLLGQPDEIARRNEMITMATHSVALFSAPLLFFGFLGLSRRLGLERPLVSVALIAYGMAVFAATCAVVINGLVGPVLTREILMADETDRQLLRMIFMNNTLLNQAFDKVFLVSSSLAIISWSLSLIRGDRPAKIVAFLGTCLGLVSIIGLFSGRLQMNIHGFGLLVFGEVIWTLFGSCPNGPFRPDKAFTTRVGAVRGRSPGPYNFLVRNHKKKEYLLCVNL